MALRLHLVSGASRSGDCAVLAAAPAGSEGILSGSALDFVARLHREFRAQREDLLRCRAERQRELDAGARPDFLSQSSAIRESEWRVAPPPPDLNDRRVEITGPPERKMVINALNSGAQAFMADFEDACAPTWDNVVRGQVNLFQAVRRTIAYDAPDGRAYRLTDQPAVLMVRPRGWHLREKHFLVDGAPACAALFDFGLYFYHNARALIERGSGPYFYLPKLESHREARLWNDVFLLAQDLMGIPRGTIRATVLIETILAAFETEEILYELRDHSAGLNCGRWDYIFSFIKKFRRHPDFVLPDRAAVTMTVPMMRNYSLEVIRACHRRGAHAMGGMAAQIPNRHDRAAHERAMETVRADKRREVQEGHDGTWVAHPGLVSAAREEFDALMPGANQIDQLRNDVHVSATDLLRVPDGAITEVGLRTNIRVGVQYLEAWLRGEGCVPLYGLMEDAATAEISRAQVWQWLHHESRLDDGRRVTPAWFDHLLKDEMAALRTQHGPQTASTGRFADAAALFERISTAEELVEFLTLPAYEYVA